MFPRYPHPVKPLYNNNNNNNNNKHLYNCNEYCPMEYIQGCLVSLQYLLQKFYDFPKSFYLHNQEDTSL